MMSFSPPGRNGTISLIGLVGKSSAAAAQGSSSTALSQVGVRSSWSRPHHSFFVATYGCERAFAQCLARRQIPSYHVRFLSGIANKQRRRSSLKRTATAKGQTQAG